MKLGGYTVRVYSWGYLHLKRGGGGGGGGGTGCLLTELVAGPLAILIADLRKLYARL